MKSKLHSAIEPLESRIAPASVLTYTDIDGDRVTIKSTLGDLAGHATIVGGQLRLLDLGAPSFDGTSITVSVVKAGAGDGLAAIGRINGGTNDFGAIVIKGDLGDIDAGSNTAGTPAIKSLSVRTLGRYGTATQAPGGNLRCDIHGALGALKVAGDVKDAVINVNGGRSATLGSVSIGGSLIGGADDFSGLIYSSWNMGAVKIGHDIQGGSGRSSGRVETARDLAGVTLGGSLLGGSNESAGTILSRFNMGSVKIRHDVQGGSGVVSGMVLSEGKLGNVTVGGSIIGGSNSTSGGIYSGGDMGLVKIGHDVQGGSGRASGIISSNGDIAGVIVGGDLKGGSISTGSLSRSGLIESTNGRIASVTIGGSVFTGVDNSAGGSLTENATIRAANDIGAITVKGSLVGSVGIGGNITKVIISARGQEFRTAVSDVAIGKISIGGRVESAQILAGYDVYLAPLNGTAQIGAVTVGGDWVASDLIAGVQDGGAAGFGDAGDTLIPGDLIAKIASIAIKGIVVGTAAAGDRFGFESHTIGSFKANGVTIPIISPVALSPITADVTLRLR